MLTTIPRIRKVPLQWQSGLLSLIALASASLPASAEFNPSPVAVLTQRYNAQRTGANLDEHVLTVESVASPDFQKLYTIPVTGQVYAQPLLVPQVRFPDGTSKNILIVATMHNDVFAFQVADAIHGSFPPQQLWMLNIGPALPSNFMPMGYSHIDCLIPAAQYSVCIPDFNAPPIAPQLPPVGSAPGTGQGLFNINPLIGILSTPVIDLASNKIFVVGKMDRGAGPENDLVAIDLVGGREISRVQIAGSVIGNAPEANNGVLTFDNAHQMQRPALLLQNGEIYIAFGSHQDTPPWHGWIFRYDANTLQQTAIWCSTPNSGGGSIWQAGSGIAGDAAGNVYVMTGNGCNLDSNFHCAATQYPAEINGPPDTSYDRVTNFADMFVQLSPELNLPVAVAPGDEAHRDSEDVDLGSAGPVFVPGTTSLVGGDKEGQFYVLSTSPSLQLQQTFQAAQPFDQPSFQGSGYHHIHGSPVFWRGPQGMTAYVWAERDYLRAFSWDDTSAHFGCNPLNPNCLDIPATPSQQSTIESPTCGHCMPGGALSVSAEGPSSGTGIVWASMPVPTSTPDILGGALNNIVPGVLRALDAEDITKELWNTGCGDFMFAKYTPPMVANGRVYMATFGSVPNQAGGQAITGSVNVYGLRQWAKFLSQTSPSGRVGVGANFQASVTFFNAGTTTWTQAAYTLSLVAKRPSTANIPLTFPLPADVPPGNQVTFTLPNLSSAIAGMLSYQWQMNQTNIESFGDPSPWVSLQVGGRLASTEAAGRVFDQAKVTITDADTHLPVKGAQITGTDDTGTFGPLTTDALGNVTFTLPHCTKASGNPRNSLLPPKPLSVPCAATASKSPDYAPLNFFLAPAQ